MAALEAVAAPNVCRTCAERPVFTLADDATSGSRPCPECGRLPLVFTIAIDRLDPLPADAA